MYVLVIGLFGEFSDMVSLVLFFEDPLQGDFPEVIEEYLEHGVMKCIAFNRRGTLLAGTCITILYFLRSTDCIVLPFIIVTSYILAM